MASIIGVETLQHTNGTTAATIDSSGHMKVGGNKIAWSAKRSGDQTGYDGTSPYDDPVIYNDEDYDYGSNYSTTTGLFTAPVKGPYVYHVGYFSSGIAAQQIWIMVNGTRKETTVVGDGTTQYISGSGVVELDVNDTLGVFAYTNNSNTTITANEYHTFFKGALIMAY